MALVGLWCVVCWFVEVCGGLWCFVPHRLLTSPVLMELHHEKTRFLPMRKQRCRSASQ